MLNTFVLMMVMACGGGESEGDDNANVVADQRSDIEKYAGKFMASIDRGAAEDSFADAISEFKAVASHPTALHVLINVGSQASKDSVSAKLEKLHESDESTLAKFFIFLHHELYSEASSLASATDEKNAERAKGMRTLIQLASLTEDAESFSASDTAQDWVGKLAIAQVGFKEGKLDASNVIFTELAAIEAKDNRLAKLHGHLGLAKGHSTSAGRTENAEQALALAMEFNDLHHIGASLEALANSLGASEESALFDEKLTAVFNIDEYLGKADMFLLGFAIAEGLSATGDYYNAHRLLVNAREKMAEGSDKSGVAWQEALAAFYLRDAAGVSAAKSSNSNSGGLMVDQLVRAAKGESIGMASDILKEAPSKDFIKIAISLGETDVSAFGEIYIAAKTKAKKLGDKVSQLDLDLINESNQREIFGQDTTALLDAIETDYGSSFPNLKSEVAVRRFLLTGEAALGEDVGDEGIVAGWKAYMAGELLSGKTTNVKALAGLALIRKAHETGKGYKKAMNAVWQSLPIHRLGPLSLGTVLDGSQGVRGMDMVSSLVGATDSQKVASALIVMEQNRRRKSFRKDYSVGGNLIYGIEAANRGKLVKATHRARQAVRQFWAGGSEPNASLESLATIETELTAKRGGDTAFKSLKLYKNVDLESLYEQLNGYAIISYAVHGEDLLGVVISPDKASIRNLGKFTEIQAIIADQEKLLYLGSTDRTVFRPRAKSHKTGNALNLKLLGPFNNNALSGFGRYVIIADDELLRFSLSVLPDQQDGLRFLQDNRMITSSTGLAEMLRSSPELGSFTPDVYAVSKPDSEMSTKTEDSDELIDVSQRLIPPSFAVVRNAAFEKSRTVMLVGRDAKVESYAESAASARYISFSGMNSTSTGGFKMADGELTLSQIAQQPLLATVVFLDYDQNHTTQMKRVRAFLNAGARSVVVGSWSLQEKHVRPILMKIFDSLNRDRPIQDSFQLARKEYEKSVFRDLKMLGSSALAKNATNNPGVWGGFHLFGRSTRDN